MAIQLGIIVPCYNEEEVLPETNKRLLNILTRLQNLELIANNSVIYYVDDGSKDRTWEIIDALAVLDSRVHGIKLSRNCGHQNALLAGIFSAEGDALVTIDADLQDDITVIEQMVRQFTEGFEIVYGVRKTRSTDSFLKRGTATIYYKFLAKMGVEIINNHADFRLLGRRPIDYLRQFSEINLFLRGLIPLLGFTSSTVYYDRAERLAGTSKYSLQLMLALAVDGITSFSTVPLRFIAIIGLLLFLISIIMTIWVLYVRLFTYSAIPGWASSVIPIYFIGGIQLLSIGVVGEYVAKIYLEVKRRPRYCIEKQV